MIFPEWKLPPFKMYVLYLVTIFWIAALKFRVRHVVHLQRLFVVHIFTGLWCFVQNDAFLRFECVSYRQTFSCCPECSLHFCISLSHNLFALFSCWILSRIQFLDKLVNFIKSANIYFINNLISMVFCQD